MPNERVCAFIAAITADGGDGVNFAVVGVATGGDNNWDGREDGSADPRADALVDDLQGSETAVFPKWLDEGKGDGGAGKTSRPFIRGDAGRL